MSHDLDLYKTKLLSRKAELDSAAATGDQAAQPVELDQTRVGRISRMDALQAQAMSVESQRRRKVELVRIDAAVKRIAADEYGHCLDCDNEIPAKRLDFDPAATLCVGCAQKRER